MGKLRASLHESRDEFRQGMIVGWPLDETNFPLHGLFHTGIQERKIVVNVFSFVSLERPFFFLNCETVIFFIDLVFMQIVK